MIKRPYLATVALGLTVSLVANLMPNVALAGAPTPAQNAFRANVGVYLQNLKVALGSAASNPATAAAMAPKLAEFNTALETATLQLGAMSPDELDAMQRLTGSTALWITQPQGLTAQLSSVSAKAPSTPPPGFLSLCTGSLGDIRGLFYGYWVAAQIASAASAVAAGFPSSLTFLPGLIIVAIIFGVANGIAIALAKNLSLAGDCSTAAANATLATTYPHDPSNPVVTVRASSQISVNTLTTLSGGIKDTLDMIRDKTIVITANLTEVINRVGTAQGTANAILTTVTDLQDRNTDLLGKIGDPPSVVNTTTANGLANTINIRLTTILGNTDAFQKLTVRAEIERNLADRSAPVVALFALPQSQKGYLEVVRDIVALSIANELASGMTVGTAQANLAQGNAQYAAGQFQAAYLSYDAAYLAAVN